MNNAKGKNITVNKSAWGKIINFSFFKHVKSNFCKHGTFKIITFKTLGIHPTPRVSRTSAAEISRNVRMLLKTRNKSSIFIISVYIFLSLLIIYNVLHFSFEFLLLSVSFLLSVFSFPPSTCFLLSFQTIA